MSKEDLIYAQATIDGRCIDLILTQEQLMQGFETGLARPDLIPACGQCWDIKKPNKCGVLDRIMNRCCVCNDE